MTAPNASHSVGSRLRRLPAWMQPHRPGTVTILLAGLLFGAFVLRITAIQHGLPFAYNPDEELHFVPQAADAADGDYNPNYFENPSALTYLFALVFKIVFAGEDVTKKLGQDPKAVFTAARLVVAMLGTLLVGLVYWAGQRFYDRTVGLIAGGIVGFGFLPVYYSHQALNDVPTLLPLTVALVGCLLVYERGDWWTYVLAGAAVGVAGGTKYLAAPMALIVALAVGLRVLEKKESPVRAVALLAGAGAACIAALLALNPYILLDFSEAKDQFGGQSDQASTAKLGQDGAAWSYYPKSLLWGFGLVPLLLAIAGAVYAVREHRNRALLLIAFPVVLYLYMATQERFFGRWILPMYPALAILAGYGAVRIAGWLAARPRVAGTTAAVLVLPLLTGLALAQPLADSVRSDGVLASEDTRTQARSWIRRYVKENRKIVVEPSVPAKYLVGTGYIKYPIKRPFQAYQKRLTPQLLDTYRAEGFCWVMVNSHQRDRGLAAGLEGAKAYYARLERETRRKAVFSPYRTGAKPPDFSYDFSFNWYPRAYERPGPLIEVRRLTNCSTAGA